MSGYDYLFGDIPIARADRQPCPICGHPTGDCVGEDNQELHRIFGLGLFDSLDGKQTFTVLEDIIEERQITPYTTTKVIKYKKGQQIPLSTARELGLTEQ